MHGDALHLDRRALQPIEHLAQRLGTSVARDLERHRIVVASRRGEGRRAADRERARVGELAGGWSRRG